MSKISLDLEEMRQYSNELGGYGNEMTDLVSRITTSVTNLHEDWIGAASDSYYERYLADQKYLLEACELLAQISADLAASANTMEEQDQNIANSFNH